jgi:hypothetical protein
MNPRRHPASSLKFGIALAAFSSVALALATGCASSSSAPVGITKSEAMVAGCSKLGEVTVEKKVPDGDVNNELAAQARKQNANYVVVATDGARTGVAYRCTSPSAAASR